MRPPAFINIVSSAMDTRRPSRTESNKEMLLRDGAAQAATTVVPLKEAFRCYRFWLGFHDLRAFTTSWLPLPIFVAYRILLFCYIFSWLLVEAITNDFRWKFFIYLTTLTNILINIDLLLLTSLCITYIILHYCKRQLLVSNYLPKNSSWYAKDNIRWYVKMSWFLHNSSLTLAFMVAIGFWSLIYKCPPIAPTTNETMPSGNYTPLTVANVSCINGATLHVHGIDAALLLVDLFLSRVPVQLYHFYQPCTFTFAYIVLTLVYWGAGGTNRQNQHYIYSLLDYTSYKFSSLFAILLVIAPAGFFVVIYLLALLRDFVTGHMKWCFRDVKVHAEQNGEGELNSADPNLHVTKVEVTVA